MKCPVYIVQKKIPVLKKTQNAEIYHNRIHEHCRRPAFNMLRFEISYQYSVYIIKHRRKEHDNDVNRFSPGIKYQAEKEQNAVSQLFRTNIVRQQHCGQKKENKRRAGKYQLPVLLRNILKVSLPLLFHRRRIPQGIFLNVLSLRYPAF